MYFIPNHLQTSRTSPQMLHVAMFSVLLILVALEQLFSAE